MKVVPALTNIAVSMISIANVKLFHKESIMYSDYERSLGSRIIKGAGIKRVGFDPTNQEHLESMYQFLTTGRWGKWQFYAELPFVSVPAYVAHQFCIHNLKLQLKKTDDRTEDRA